ncbi:hypothetical protein [Streptomyces mirabilis]|uniref:hypothetical protein n=1 Tax=Streptomyces mirabilis TaxID=68239 RepID=UPI003678B7B6
MQSALADVAQALLLPGTVGSAVGQVTGALVGALRERWQTVRPLAGCACLADHLEAEPDLDALSFYPHLLAWELARLPKGLLFDEADAVFGKRGTVSRGTDRYANLEVGSSAFCRSSCSTRSRTLGTAPAGTWSD